MNPQGTSSLSDSARSKTFVVNFNQDCTSLAVCNKNGYRLFAICGVDNLDQIYGDGKVDAVLAERLFSSSLIAIVSLDTPRTLLLRHYKKGSEICNYSYSNTILSCKLNRARLVVCLEESLYIHNIRDMRMLHTIRDTPPNPQGLCALSVNNENHYLAYPGSATTGEVQIFDAGNLHSKIVISAHESPLAAMVFNPSGTRIATASEKGTVIRVFSVADGTKLYEFRRGMKRCVAISCLAFSMCSQFLGCSSNTETVHIFKMDEVAENAKKNTEGSLMGYLSSYLPTQVTDVLSQDRAFYTAHLPRSGLKSTIAITMVEHVLRLLVATEDGYLYLYNLEGSEGGFLVLLKQFNFNVPLEENRISPVVDNTNSDADTVTAMDSDKYREMTAATESPPTDGLQLNNDREYPPLFQKKD